MMFLVWNDQNIISSGELAFQYVCMYIVKICNTSYNRKFVRIE